MKIVRQTHRPMLQALSDDVFAHYSGLSQSGFNFEGILWNSRISPYSTLPEGPLKSAIHDWAARFHAAEDWLLDDTLRTLRGWFVAPDWREALRWNPHGSVISVLVTGERFCFQCEGWEMQGYTWEDYRRSVTQRFEQKLREYESESRELAESRGLVRAPLKYSPANFKWFVQYQFAGLTSTEIVRRESLQRERIDESTVLKGIKAAAKLLGWGQLRKPKGYSSRKIR